MKKTGEQSARFLENPGNTKASNLRRIKLFEIHFDRSHR